MKTLGVVCPCFEDATSLYRGMGPLAGLKNHVQLEKLYLDKGINWEKIRHLDGMFFQRAFNTTHLEVLKMAKNSHLPIWLDYDDDLFHVPTDNPTWKIYGKDAVKITIKECLKLADFVSVSTRALQDSFEEQLKDELKKPVFVVIPNAHDNLKLKRDLSPQRDKFVMWRGSETHIRDLLTYAPEIVRLSNEFPEWTWLFLGQYPWMMVEHVPPGRMMYNDAVDPVLYFKLIKELRPSLMFAPLHDSKFNRAKSNIVWLEATYAGAATVAPEWEEWRKPGVLHYSNRQEFHSAMHSAMKSTELSKLTEASWQYIEENLTLSKVNELRVDLLSRLFELR